MEQHTFLLLSILLLFIRVSKDYYTFKGNISSLTIYMLCYFYFCFGPYVANMLDISVYSGINMDYILQASMVFFLAIAGLALAPSKILVRIHSQRFLIAKRPKLARKIAIIVMFLSIVSLFTYAFMRIGFSPIDKVQRIQLVGFGHYELLTLWPAVLFSYLAFSPFSQLKKTDVFWLATVLLPYFSYCIYIGERDFVLIVIPLFFWMYQDRKVSPLLLFLFAMLIGVVFVAMSAGRTSVFDTSSFALFLNQGSNLMVTSNVIGWLEYGTHLEYGVTYFSSLINMLTLGAIKLTLPLSIWFSRKYFYGFSNDESYSFSNDGAYGFSVEGEVILNFGIIGVPFVFALFSIYLTSTFKGYLKHRAFSSLLTYFNLFYFTYAIRGESLIIFKSFIYCFIIFIVLLLVSQRGRLYFNRNIDAT